jgi:biopolymer transport protein ExbD
MKIQKAPFKKARIEIIPMIDVIFFLLVFFMFSSFSMVRMKGVSMALPRQGNGTEKSAQGNAVGPAKLVVTVNPQGEYFIGRRKVAHEEFKNQMGAALARTPDAIVILNVAKTQSAQNLIDVIDSVNTTSSPSGKPLQLLIATEPVDAEGNALPPNVKP